MELDGEVGHLGVEEGGVVVVAGAGHQLPAGGGEGGFGPVGVVGRHEQVDVVHGPQAGLGVADVATAGPLNSSGSMPTARRASVARRRPGDEEVGLGPAHEVVGTARRRRLGAEGVDGVGGAERPPQQRTHPLAEGGLDGEARMGGSAARARATAATSGPGT